MNLPIEQHSDGTQKIFYILQTVIGKNKLLKIGITSDTLRQRLAVLKSDINRNYIKNPLYSDCILFKTIALPPPRQARTVRTCALALRTTACRIYYILSMDNIPKNLLGTIQNQIIKCSIGFKKQNFFRIRNGTDPAPSS